MNNIQKVKMTQIKLKQKLLKKKKELEKKDGKKQKMQIKDINIQLGFLKEFNRKYVLKFAVINKRSYRQAICEHGCKAEQKALYKLICHPTLSKLVCEFIEKHKKLQDSKLAAAIVFALGARLKKRRKNPKIVQAKDVKGEERFQKWVFSYAKIPESDMISDFIRHRRSELKHKVTNEDKETVNGKKRKRSVSKDKESKKIKTKESENEDNEPIKSKITKKSDDGDKGTKSKKTKKSEDKGKERNKTKKSDAKETKTKKTKKSKHKNVKQFSLSTTKKSDSNGDEDDCNREQDDTEENVKITHSSKNKNSMVLTNKLGVGFDSKKFLKIKRVVNLADDESSDDDGGNSMLAADFFAPVKKHTPV